MENLITSVLEYSLIGQVQIEGTPVDSKALVNEILEDLTPLEGYSVDIAEDMPCFLTAKIHLKQVFSNLISNSINYHEKAKPAHISIYRLPDSGEFYRFCVEDDGPGIPPINQDKVFTIFQTMEPSDTTKSTRIGLAVVKKIIESYGGSIEIVSDGITGSQFIFSWPKSWVCMTVL